jgi:glycosyltransferase involved in cell wall biosynthesis
MFRPDQLAGGQYSYLENLLRGLVALAGDHSPDKMFDTTLFYSTPIPWNDERVSFRSAPASYGRFAAHAWVGAVASRRFDTLLFPNYFTPPVIRADRAIAVIHDLQFRHMRRFYSIAKWQWLNACHRLTLAKCRTVVAISNVVREDILSQYGAKWERRVQTVHNPICLERFEQIGDISQFVRDRPYIMCVAMDRPQKNLHTLVRAFDRIKERYPDHMLVMAGQLRRLRPDRQSKVPGVAIDLPSVEDLVAKMGLQDRVVVTGFISDAQLSALYRGASVFVLPSLFEGFGMPAAEALALGTATIVSNLPVLREITLGSAQYLADPKCVGELAERIADILGKSEAARPSPDLTQKIRDHYDPKRIARQYYELMFN